MHARMAQHITVGNQPNAGARVANARNEIVMPPAQNRYG